MLKTHCPLDRYTMLLYLKCYSFAIVSLCVHFYLSHCRFIFDIIYVNFAFLLLQIDDEWLFLTSTRDYYTWVINKWKSQRFVLMWLKNCKEKTWMWQNVLSTSPMATIHWYDRRLNLSFIYINNNATIDNKLYWWHKFAQIFHFFFLTLSDRKFLLIFHWNRSNRFIQKLII